MGSWSDLQYFDGYWYAISPEKGLTRFNFDSDKVENLKAPPSNDRHYSFYIDQTLPKPLFWIFGNKKHFSTYDFKTWTEFPQSDIGIMRILYKKGPTIIVQNLKPDGVRVKNGDISNSWSAFFEGSKPSNIVKDKCDHLFIGLENVEADASNGVWWSKDKGQHWSPFGEGAEKSFVTGLAIDETTQILYAATAGESLLRISLPECAQ